MASSHDYDNVPRAVRNETFYLIARLCMILGSTIGIPMAGYMLSSVISKANEIAATQQEQTITLRVLSATMAQRLDMIDKTMNDHELRLRKANQ